MRPCIESPFVLSSEREKREREMQTHHAQRAAAARKDTLFASVIVNETGSPSLRSCSIAAGSGIVTFVPLPSAGFSTLSTATVNIPVRTSIAISVMYPISSMLIRLLSTSIKTR